MSDWKQRLFDNYVTTGQAKAPLNLARTRDPYIERLIRQHVPADRHISILDVACGHGRLIYHLQTHGYLQVAGVDVSPEQVSLAHRLGVPQVRCCNLFEYLAESGECTFDVVFLMDILEHFGPQQTLDALDAVCRVLKQHGILVAHVPNGEGILAMRVRYGDFTHHQAFTQQSISQVLTACSFHDIRCYEDKPPIHGIKSFTRRLLWEGLTIPYRLLLAAESGIFTGIFSQNLLVTARKR